MHSPADELFSFERKKLNQKRNDIENITNMQCRQRDNRVQLTFFLFKEKSSTKKERLKSSESLGPGSIILIGDDEEVVVLEIEGKKRYFAK